MSLPGFRTIVLHVLLTQIPAACYISRRYATEKRFESKMNFCTVLNITVIVSSEKESLPYKRKDNEGV